MNLRFTIYDLRFMIFYPWVLPTVIEIGPLRGHQSRVTSHHFSLFIVHCSFDNTLSTANTRNK